MSVKFIEKAIKNKLILFGQLVSVLIEFKFSFPYYSLQIFSPAPTAISSAGRPRFAARVLAARVLAVRVLAARVLAARVSVPFGNFDQFAFLFKYLHFYNMYPG
jgi:hypothetical protein